MKWRNMITACLTQIKISAKNLCDIFGQNWSLFLIKGSLELPCVMYQLFNKLQKTFQFLSSASNSTWSTLKWEVDYFETLKELARELKLGAFIKTYAY